MRRIPLTLAVAAGLVIAGAAAATLPADGSFAGTTSARSINGFQDIVTFKVLSAGRSVRQFQFGTTGCSGLGLVPVGVDPYTYPNVATVPSMKVSATGVIDFDGAVSLPESQGIVTTALIKATITSRTSVSGTISVSQRQNGGAACSAPLLKFHASPGTPESLGLNGS
jgi:hypothetical protein